MRVAVVGLGYWGPNHVRNLAALDACTGIVAVDVDAKRAADVARAHVGTEPATDLDEVLRDDSVAAVVLATPVDTHATLARRIIDAGKSVLIEKPFATSRVDAEELVALAGSRGVLAAAGHTFLYSPPVLAVRDLLRGGELGEPIYLHSSRVNLGIHSTDVSVLWDLLPHDLSILLHWVDERPQSVSATGRASVAGHPPDVAFVDIGFASGFVANLHLSWLAPTKVRRMTLVGTRRMVVYEDTHPDEPVKVYDKGVDIPDPEDFGEYKLIYRTGDIVSPRVPVWEPLRHELQDFLTRVAAGETPDEREQRVVDIVAAVEAAEKSMNDGGTPVLL
ncbi:MAG TPA: Gfo/Idh/MocA family oxidoreductase [Mycobacteriales bacterium]|nr:Gfo/Idh/MocA family oxidoreductase [Mycobacteriales bacterium]